MTITLVAKSGTIVSKVPQGTARQEAQRTNTFVGYTRHDDDHDDDTAYH